jgi:drug/metabolite transporter (DMT)-like permease|tara:strand:- start:548 stop:787 length:240 start_codon:yes stop_codon:yes gene_type:complete
MKKTGIKSTEFWISIVGMLGGVILASMEGSQWTQVIGAILAAVCGGSYTMGRSLVKSNEAKAGIIGEAIKKTSKLKKSS